MGELKILFGPYYSVVLQISASQLQIIAAQAEGTYPQECCGLLLGQISVGLCQVRQVWPMVNAWNDQIAADLGMDCSHGKGDRYWIDPAEMLQAMRKARSRSQEIVGVYHSHPDHEAVPSECDRQLAWPDYVYLIVSVNQGGAIAHNAWMLDDHHTFQSVPLLIDTQTPEMNCLPLL